MEKAVGGPDVLAGIDPSRSWIAFREALIADLVVVSHLHPDHFLDLTGLEVFWAYHERTDLPQLPIHAPASLPERLAAVMCRAGDVPDGVDTVPFAYLAISDRHVFEVGPLRFDIARGLDAPDSPFTLHLDIGTSF